MSGKKHAYFVRDRLLEQYNGYVCRLLLVFAASVSDTGPLDHQVTKSLIALMMEAARTCETLVNFYQITRGYNPEDSHLRTHRRENLRSYLYPFCLNVFFRWLISSSRLSAPHAVLARWTSLFNAACFCDRWCSDLRTGPVKQEGHLLLC
jgi:hypothetical protein